MPNAIDDKQILVLQDGSEKYCPHCRAFKPMTEFYAMEASPDNKQSWCKECQSEYHKQRRIDKTYRNEEFYRLYKRLYDMFEAESKRGRNRILKEHRRMLDKMNKAKKINT